MQKNKDKDILFMSQFYYPEYVTTASLLTDLAEHLSSSGMKVGVLCGYPKEYTEKSDKKRHPLCENVNGVEINRVRYLHTKRTGFIGRLTNYFSFVISVYFHLKKAKNYKAVVVTSSPPILPYFASIAKKRYHNKLVFLSYDVYPEIALVGGYTGKRGIMERGLEYSNRKALAVIDKTVSMCDDMSVFLRKNRNISFDSVEMIPNWYRDKGENPKLDRKKTKLFSDYDNEDFVVSYFGNLGVCQDMDTIADAMKLLKNNNRIKFIFAGHGTKFDSFKKFIKDENITNARVYSFLSGDDYKEALGVSDVFIVSLIDGLLGLCAPSKSYTYFMAARPVISIMHKDSEIASDIISFPCGNNFNNGDAAGIAKYITELSENPEKCEEYGKNSRKVYLAKYEESVCLEEYRELLSRVISDKNG